MIIGSWHLCIIWYAACVLLILTARWRRSRPRSRGIPFSMHDLVLEVHDDAMHSARDSEMVLSWVWRFMSIMLQEVSCKDLFSSTDNDHLMLHV